MKLSMSYKVSQIPQIKYNVQFTQFVHSRWPFDFFLFPFNFYLVGIVHLSLHFQQNTKLISLKKA